MEVEEASEEVAAEPEPIISRPIQHPIAQEPENPVEEELFPDQKSEKHNAKQEDFKFEPVKRGRFEKSEPTMVEGEDLDVPTFLRKNARV